MIRRACFVALFAWATHAPTVLAQEFDNRFQSIAFAADALTQVRTSPGTTQTVLFARGEQIRSVLLSDPGAFFVSVSGNGDSLVLRANGPGALAVMTIETSERRYRLELVGGGGAQNGEVPQIIRFTYAPQGTEGPRGPPEASPPGISWRLSGDTALRPARISDDGEKTYISWPEKVPMPAVFALDSKRREQLVDGYVRSGAFTIDKVYERLVFRIDRREATARRVETREAMKHD